MKGTSPAAELKALRRFIADAEKKFLAPHLGAATALGTPTKDEELDVAAFVVLAHGAIENFIEGVGLWVLETIENKWIMKKRSTRCLASLLLHHDASEIDTEVSMSTFDKIRAAIDDAKSDASKLIHDNNGIAIHHVRGIFARVGVDVPGDPKLTGSLESLVSLRHQWAHQYRYGAKVTKFAADVQTTCKDCLEFAELLVAGVRSARP
jgi:hypothetical protein